MDVGEVLQVCHCSALRAMSSPVLRSRKLQGLEAEKNLLAAAEARSAGEAAEHYRERCRLSAELEALRKIQSARYRFDWLLCTPA